MNWGGGHHNPTNVPFSSRMNEAKSLVVLSFLLQGPSRYLPALKQEGVRQSHQKPGSLRGGEELDGNWDGIACPRMVVQEDSRCSRPGFSLSKQGWDPERGTSGWLVKGESATHGCVLVQMMEMPVFTADPTTLPRGPESLLEDRD